MAELIKFDKLHWKPSVRLWPGMLLPIGMIMEIPVMKWLNPLPEDVRGNVIARIDRLKECGPTLDYPYTSQIDGRLRQVRLRIGKTRYRVLYFFDDERMAIHPVARTHEKHPGSGGIRQAYRRRKNGET